MSYKFTTGSVRRGDIYFEDDRTGDPTYIDFGQDQITLRPSVEVSGSDDSILFNIKSDNNPDVLVVTGSGLVAIGAADPKVALDVHMDPTGLVNDTGGGMVIKFGGGSLAKGKLYYLHTNGNWTATDSSAVSSGADQLLAISLGTDAAVDGMLIRGFFDAESELDNFSAGKVVYVSEIASKMDTAPPTTSAAFVRVVGYCTDQSKVIYFNPSGDWVELV